MNIEIEQTNLEDLILLGEDERIPITVEFPKGESKVSAKAMIKPLTLAEIDKLKLNQDNLLKSQLEILKISLFKTDGEPFSEKLLMKFPLGVVNKISEKILEVSGVDYNPKDLRDF